MDECCHDFSANDGMTSIQVQVRMECCDGFMTKMKCCRGFMAKIKCCRGFMAKIKCCRGFMAKMNVGMASAKMEC